MRMHNQVRSGLQADLYENAGLIIAQDRQISPRHPSVQPKTHCIATLHARIPPPLQLKRTTAMHKPGCSLPARYLVFGPSAQPHAGQLQAPPLASTVAHLTLEDMLFVEGSGDGWRGVMWWWEVMVD